MTADTEGRSEVEVFDGTDRVIAALDNIDPSQCPVDHYEIDANCAICGGEPLRQGLAQLGDDLAQLDVIVFDVELLDASQSSAQASQFATKADGSWAERMRVAIRRRLPGEMERLVTLADVMSDARRKRALADDGGLLEARGQRALAEARSRWLQSEADRLVGSGWRP